MLLALVVLDYRQALGAAPGMWLLAVLLLVSVLATQEVLALLAAKNHRPAAWPVYAGNVLIPLSACLPMFFHVASRPLPADTPLGPFGWPLVVLTLAAIAVLFEEMQRFERPGRATVNAALGIFTLVYIGLLGSFLALLRQFGGNEWGMAALVSMLLIVKTADTAAYFAGKNFGRRKMSPVLSPGKTWEGAVGGLVGACLVSWAFFAFLAPPIVGPGYVQPPLAATLAYGAILAIAGIVGDLAESLLKRDMERKDSSSWVPGLGGVLDIVDAILVAAPAAWLCWAFGLVGPVGQ